MKRFINIKSVINIMNDDTEANVIDSFLRYSDNDFTLNSTNNLESQELKDLSKLFIQIIDDLSMAQLDGYFLNSSIEQGIREQFDVLRYSEKSILNIELKSKLPKRGISSIRNQLVRHKYMLELFENVTVNVFTYVSETNKLYTLENDDKNSLVPIPISKLIDYIDVNYLKENILNELDSTAMVVSPYNEPEKFIEHKYFLNNDQTDIVSRILLEEGNFIILKGGAGSGKSLVLFDLAKKYREQGKNVCVLFCAKLSHIDQLNKIYDFDIVSTNHKDYHFGEDELAKYDVIMIDETQRMYSNHHQPHLSPEKLQRIVKLTENIQIIFAIDQEQSTHKSEIVRNNQQYLESQENAKIYELKYKVRTDKKMGIFIQKMLNFTKRNLEVVDFNEVSVSYYGNRKDAIEYSNYLRDEEKFKLIEMSEYLTASTRVTKRPKLNPQSTNLYDVFGQEYDNVAVIIDEHYCYEEGYFKGIYGEYYPYNQIKSFAQALTRVKRKLELIIVNNPEVYTILQKIMTWKEDKVNDQSLEYFKMGLFTNKNSLKNLIKYLDLRDENELISLIQEDSNYAISISVKDIYQHLKNNKL